MTANNDDLRHYAIEVKPIGAACNLRCEYCYYLGKGSGHSAAPALMSDAVLERYVQQVIAIHGRRAEIEFAWHGGEPTLAGIPFFEKARECAPDEPMKWAFELRQCYSVTGQAAKAAEMDKLL